uniref:Uncharacterized protein n=1 Tax=Toxoplasma gondii (strain ATCC 50861 / VEG) TaxID=432359 RepID=A0A0F7UZ50_TOXGV|nr:TPA: hypothetical protein BN1205_017560 [Toxoplasma gondii VEG]
MATKCVDLFGNWLRSLTWQVLLRRGYSLLAENGRRVTASSYRITGSCLILPFMLVCAKPANEVHVGTFSPMKRLPSFNMRNEKRQGEHESVQYYKQSTGYNPVDWTPLLGRP